MCEEDILTYMRWFGFARKLAYWNVRLSRRNKDYFCMWTAFVHCCAAGLTSGEVHKFGI